MTATDATEDAQLSTDEYRHLVAYHEAGHSVVAHALGHSIVLLSVQPDPHRQGFSETVPPEDVTGLEATVETVIVHLAGRMAEELYAGRPPTSYIEVDPEAARAASLAAMAPHERGFIAQVASAKGADDMEAVLRDTATVDERDAFLAWVRTRCRRLVYANAPAIHALAAELDARTYLAGPEAESIIAAARRD